jgi:hypothetical protein
MFLPSVKYQSVHYILRSFATIIQYLVVKATTFDAFRQLGWKNRKIICGRAKLMILQGAISNFWDKVFLVWQILPTIKVGYEQRKSLNSHGNHPLPKTGS